jgi:cell pole-organizing protein PopZ
MATIAMERPVMAKKQASPEKSSSARQEGSSTRIHDDVLQMARALLGVMPRNAGGERNTMIDLLSDILRPELQKRLKASQSAFGEIASGGVKSKGKRGQAGEEE